jgi:hypothetical protein
MADQCSHSSMASMAPNATMPLRGRCQRLRLSLIPPNASLIQEDSRHDVAETAQLGIHQCVTRELQGNSAFVEEVA